MLSILDSAATWLKWVETKKEEVMSRPPDWVAGQILARLEWPFRYLEAITETPTLRPDGSVVDVPGWDEKTGLLYLPTPGMNWPGVPDRPTERDLSEAITTLRDPVQDFPFVADSDRAAYVAAVLSLIARHMIDGPVPMFPVRAPTPGTGKTMLVDVVSLIATGREAPAMTMTFETEELRKRITSLAVGGAPLVLLDNLSGSIGADGLAAALTKTEWEDRVLGSTQMVRVPLRTVWFATGNNLGFRRTLGRRVVPIDLDARIEQPEDRTGFKHRDLLAYVRVQRPRLVAAALTILRAFHLAGRPTHGKSRMGSFEAWDDLVRSAVVWCGLDDPAGTEGEEGRGRIRSQADDDVEQLAALLGALHRVFPHAVPFSSAQVIAKAKSDEEFSAIIDTAAAPSRGGHATPHSIGARFRDHQGRPVGGLVLKKTSASWQVVPAEHAP